MQVGRFTLYLLVIMLSLSCSKNDPDIDGSTSTDPYEQQELQKYPEAGQVKIMSFNVRYGTAKEANSSNNWSNRKEACVEMIKDQKPSCIGFQEAVYELQFKYFLEELKDEYDGYGVGRDDGKESGECMGILYRRSEIRKIDGGTFWLSPTPDTPSKADVWNAACFRSATWGIFEVISTGKRFCYINTHLDHASSLARTEGMKIIRERFELYNPGRLPQFLSADFNSGPTNSIFTLIPGMMNSRDLAPSAATDQERTYNGWGDSTGQIDDILFSSPAETIEYHTVTEPYKSVAYLSDHYPIYAIFSLK